MKLKEIEQTKLYQKLSTKKEIILKADLGPQEQLIWSYL